MLIEATRLWAKSAKHGEGERLSMFLPGHLADAYAAAEKVLDATGDDQLCALGLDPSVYRDRLRRCVLLAAAIHDLGKANDHFQDMISRKRNVQQNPQGIRHEWVTVLLLREALRNWLLPAVDRSEADYAIVGWAVAGHHPAHHHESPPRLCPAGGGKEINLLATYDDFSKVLEWLATTFAINGAIPAFEKCTRPLVNAGNVFQELSQWAREGRKIWQVLPADERRFVAAVKTCLIAADVAGSALPRAMPEDANRWQWISDSFAAKPELDDLQAIIDYRLNGSEPREFQTAVASSTASVIFVKAGCGTGKTLAAYMWARARCAGRRLYFCYPTTGTATEGYRDYLFPPEADLETGEQNPLAKKICRIGAKLFHSRRDVDLEILETGDDTKGAENELAARLESLETWATPIVSCTVDTVLGLVQNNKRGLFAWPALAKSAFVFDEIHAYDDRLFGALLRFLRDLPGLPVLLMTASLPLAREEALRTTLKKSRDVELEPIHGPTELEELPRYQKLAAERNALLQLVKNSLDSGSKVLWVCNTVGRVMEAANRAEALGLTPLIYHSRFRYIDRVERHKAVIDAFNPKKNAGKALAVCSQVAEMSLDLSADLLITDLAPVPALIQRMGRLNRRAKKGDPTKPFVVVEQDGHHHLPYTPSDLDAARHWLLKLTAMDISQRHLADMWEQTADNPPDLVPSAWLDGGPTTSVTELREASPGITVLLKEDVHAARANPKLISRFVLPMPPPPRSVEWREWQRFRGLPIADPGTITYDKLRGAEWLN